MLQLGCSLWVLPLVVLLSFTLLRWPTLWPPSWSSCSPTTAHTTPGFTTKQTHLTAQTSKQTTRIAIHSLPTARELLVRFPSLPITTVANGVRKFWFWECNSTFATPGVANCLLPSSFPNEMTQKYLVERTIRTL